MHDVSAGIDSRPCSASMARSPPLAFSGCPVPACPIPGHLSITGFPCRYPCMHDPGTATSRPSGRHLSVTPLHQHPIDNRFVVTWTQNGPGENQKPEREIGREPDMIYRLGRCWSRPAGQQPVVHTGQWSLAAWRVAAPCARARKQQRAEAVRQGGVSIGHAAATVSAQARLPRHGETAQLLPSSGS